MSPRRCWPWPLSTVPGASFEWYDGEKLPFPDESFDVALAICVLHHVPTLRPRTVRVRTSPGDAGQADWSPSSSTIRSIPLTRYAVNSCDLDDGVVLVTGRQAGEYLAGAGASEVQRADYLFTPFGGSLGRRLDATMARLPVGGQYVVSARAGHMPRAHRERLRPGFGSVGAGREFATVSGPWDGDDTEARGAQHGMDRRRAE